MLAAAAARGLGSRALARPGVSAARCFFVGSESEYVSPNNGAPRLPSAWNKWFPYEPVPCTPRFLPYKVWCEKGDWYSFDTSGESNTQPWEEYPGFCEERGFKPIPYTPRYSGWKLICACKHSPTRPFADGTFVLQWMDYNTGQAMLASFGASFVVGVFLTWMMHP